MGKFTACAVASHDKCYFQDDLWLNPYMDSLYTHSLRYPQLIISNTRQSNYVDYSTWRFTRPDIDLHTGFTDLRYGAFVPKEMVSSFVDQLNSHDLNSTRMKQADVYFSMWNNQYPYLVVNPLLSSGRDAFKGIDTVNNRQLVRSVMVTLYIYIYIYIYIYYNAYMFVLILLLFFFFSTMLLVCWKSHSFNVVI
jgi:hypothetical protein